ncbi:MAG: ABC transporter permease, partial [Chloroflexota bacterium]
GHGEWSTARRITIPLLRPAIAAGALLVALYTLSDFGAVALLQYETFTWAVFLQYETAFNPTLAASLSLVLVGVAVALVASEAAARRRAQYYTGANAARRDRRLTRLGRWRWPALGFSGGVALLALGVPTYVLVFWLAQGVSHGEPLLFQWSAASASMRVSALAAIAAVVAAIPVSILSVRRPGPLSGILERLSYTGFALPGIAVALGLVFFGVNFAAPLYQTTPLLVFGYVVLFLPVAVGSIRSSLLQLNPRMEEAALTLGRSRLNAFLTITLPLIWPGLAAGAVMVFLLTMKELPATLILSPLGMDTLATSIWSAVDQAFLARAAAPSLLLILVSAAPMTFLVLRERERQA